MSGSKILSDNFQLNHKRDAKSFTRNRQLNFSKLLSLVLCKSRKSAQLVLNEFFLKLEEPPVTSSAYSQARAKLKHTAFIELNKDCVVDVYYEEEDYKRHKGYRLLGMDGSKLYLPDSKDIAKEFGRIKVKNLHMESSYIGTQSSILYDVLNEIVIDAQLGVAKSSELELAHKHLEHVREKDLLIMDRGYPGYELFASILQRKADFVVRCPKNAFKVVEKFLEQNNTEEIVTLYPNKEISKIIADKQLPESIKLRLIKVILDTGEIEILASSLLDLELFPMIEFKDLYNQRWGIETYIGRIKSRLGLECFTGKTAESVRQDFFATIYISNLETVFTEEVNNELQARSQKNNYVQKVNKAISYNIIKNNIFDILFDASLQDSEREKRMELAFKTKTVAERKNRKINRKIPTPRRRARWHKSFSKFVF